MKRTNSNITENVDSSLRSVRQKIWVSTTQTRNYMIKDPLVDWLKLHRSTSTSSTSSNNFFQFITQRGKDFEEHIVAYLNNNIIPVVTVSDKITEESCLQTIRLMQEGVPVIHSAPFENKENYTRGIIDLLVRSDYLEKIVKENPLENYYRNIKGTNLSGNYHYVVIDIKFSTLPLKADGKHLLNSDNYPAYKAQLWIYTQAIGNIQGYTSHFAYILGRRWCYTSKGEDYSSDECFDKLGTIDYVTVDNEFGERTEAAISWIRDVRENGGSWGVSPPTRNELYPNMCVDSGYWNTEKKKIADDIGDITQLWYCGIKNRDIALKAGISSWRDKKCNSRNIGMNGKRAHIVDKIIKINRGNKNIILPKKIRNNTFLWRDQSIPEIYVDFEVFSDTFAPMSGIPKQPSTSTIFMIGVWYSSENNWLYKNFVVENDGYEEEYRIMDEFVKFVKTLGNPRIWYWYAEDAIWNRAETKQVEMAYANSQFSALTDDANSSVVQSRIDNIVDNWKTIRWYDLAVIFREEPIVIKGCFNFGLKNIASAMRNHGLITTKIESYCSNGLDASVKAWYALKNKNVEIMQDISEYNKFDVKVLWEIMEYLRKNH